MSTTLFREYMIRVVANITGKWDADGTPTQWMFDESDATVIVDRLIDAFVVALTGADLPDDDVLRGASATPAPFERYMARYGDAWGADRARAMSDPTPDYGYRHPLPCPNCSQCRDPERHPSGQCDGSCFTLHPVDD